VPALETSSHRCELAVPPRQTVAHSHQTHLPLHLLREGSGREFTTPGALLCERQCPATREARRFASQSPSWSSAPRVTPVRAIHPSAIPSSRMAMNPKVENEECGRSPLAESAQVHSSRGDLTNTVQNRGFGVHSPSRDHGGEGDARGRVTGSRPEPTRTLREETLASFRCSGHCPR
jgi:hypothetical protein